MNKKVRKMLGMDTDVEEEIIDKVIDVVDKKHIDETGETGVSIIDKITEGSSLMDIAKNGAFSGLTSEQRQSATFKTGTILGVSAFELGKAFDPCIPKAESYKRGLSGVVGLFEIFFSAKNVHEGLSDYDRVDKRISRRNRRPDYDTQDYDGHDSDLEE
jgi:hypothetical protein